MEMKIKTFLLLGGLTVLLVLGGSFFGKSGMIIAFIIALAMNGFSYFFSDKLVLAMYRARAVSYNEYPVLYNIMGELTQKAGMPMPKLYLVSSATPNAFATGRDPQHSAVAVTTGILDLLSENELKGVLAHELSHIKDRDILLATIAATIAGAITFLASMMRWAAMFGGGMGGGSDNRRSGGSMIGLAGMLLFAVLAPIAAMIVQLAISRSREYLADAEGARLAGNPLYLSSALKRLTQGVKARPMNNANPSTAHLFIVAPLTGKSLLNLFSTHPPMEERIRRLENLVV
ncbi:MAG TPA: zinc metalloprotease HtpX [bacterium]|nr:zinc metalloprotease HtpX [bacterium]